MCNVDYGDNRLIIHVRIRRLVMKYGEHLGALAALSAGILWGFLGIFVRDLTAAGFTPPQLTCLRYIVVAVFFLAIIMYEDRDQLHVGPRMLAVLAIVGIVGAAMNSSAYFGSMEYISLSLSTILQYIAPFLVILMSVPLFHERITPVKGAAVVIAFSGCVLCTGVLTSPSEMNLTGIGLGVASGFFFATYTVCSKKASNCGVTVNTIMLYGSVFCVLVLIPFCGIGDALALTFANTHNMLMVLGLGVLMTILPFGLYNLALSLIDTGKVVIITYVEPVAATLVGLALYNEGVSLATVLGIVMILFSLILVNRKKGAAIE